MANSLGETGSVVPQNSPMSVGKSIVTPASGEMSGGALWRQRNIVPAAKTTTIAVRHQGMKGILLIRRDRAGAEA